MQTRVVWEDGRGESHESIPLSRFYYDGAEYVVVSDDYEKLRLLHIVERAYSSGPLGSREVLVGSTIN